MMIPRQRVRYLTTADGLRLAWAESGDGPVLVKAANWLSHLEYEWESPVWRHWIRFFSRHSRFVRYDERGCGMSDGRTGDLTQEQWTRDLQSVVDAAAPSGPVALLGISQGAVACVMYAVRHPERVSRMVLYGGYSRGVRLRGSADAVREYQAIVELARLRWGSDNPAFRQVFTSRFVPGATREQLQWFNDLCLKTTSADTAARLIDARANVDVSHLLAQVKVPTLVVHAGDDQVTPVSEGRALASGIPGAQFVELDSRNHILLEHEPAWKRFCDAVLEFLDHPATGAGAGPFAALSPRERAILLSLASGASNREIAGQLHISEKTVRNHLSSVFAKLGVTTRAHAIVFARERGFTSDRA